MNPVNTLTPMDDGGYVGNLASFDFDFDFTLLPIPGDKRSDRSPDFDMMVRSPKGRPVPIGAAWSKTANGSGNDYISITADLRDLGRINVNAVKGDAEGDPMKIIPFANGAATDAQT